MNTNNGCTSTRAIFCGELVLVGLPARGGIPGRPLVHTSAGPVAVSMLESLTTSRRLEGLRTDAGAAGDLDMVAICDRALVGDEDALSECEDVISDALAAAVS